MDSDDIKLSSVNWEHGMLLTPDHFLRQERYMDSALLWLLRYASNGFGLVGGGPRLAEAERGAVRHDPIVVLEEDANSLRISVTQCRGLTPAGCIVEIDPQHPLQSSIPKAELEGVAESPIYIACEPHQKQVVDGAVDQFNPQMRTERRPAYRIALKVPADTAPYSVVVGQLRRQRYGAGYEKDPNFIPACTSLCSYSELIAAWRKIVDNVNLLSERYTALHQAMREFLVLFTERGIETAVDVETMRFVDRMVAALQDCSFEIIDPVQPPQKFFIALRRFFHTAAVYLELTPAVQQYFDTLKETGETEFIAPLEQQKQIMRLLPRWDAHTDLSVEVRSSLQALDALHRLERALEGKYIDFRISPSLEAMNFIFDRGGKVLYRLAAKPARVQGVGDELTIYFSQLRLEGRDKYRLILVGEQNAAFEKGTKIAVEIRINEGSGFRRQPVIVSSEVKNTDQRNFEFEFDAPDVPTITDLKVSLQAHLPIRTALLFTRHRFYAGQRQETPRAVEPAALPAEPDETKVPVPPAARAIPPQRPQPPAAASRLDPHVEPARDSPESNRAPWEAPPQPPRRRRLE
ncbi:MAG TPA: hypothetical protein VIX37_05490 [Candidatus Sulfotelmatobacter sp.]